MSSPGLSLMRVTGRARIAEFWSLGDSNWLSRIENVLTKVRGIVPSGYQTASLSRHAIRRTEPEGILCGRLKNPVGRTGEATLAFFFSDATPVDPEEIDGELTLPLTGRFTRSLSIELFTASHPFFTGGWRIVL